MLLAVARHPAMIMYLDNHLSVRQGWQPRQIARSAAFPPPSGLNENLAREILELHTLGVNGGYTQADVTEFARVLTGWTARPMMNVPGGGTPGFVFDAARHEPGPRTLLGKTSSPPNSRGTSLPMSRRPRPWRALRAHFATPAAICRPSMARCSTVPRPGSSRSSR